MAEVNYAQPQVDIVMGAYNGAPYIREQVQSIADQTHTDWHLYIRDDGSKDNTVALAEGLAAHDARITLVWDDLGNLGVVRNFSCLLEQTLADYVLLCDQDDYWVTDKIEKMLAFALRQEAQYGKACPLLVFSDLSVVDGDLQPLHASFLAMQKRDKNLDCSFRNLITQNVMPGCAMMVNRALLEVALPIPADADMHDWWLILAAARFGHVAHLPEPLAAYRQHANNVMGAFKTSLSAALADTRFVDGYRKRMAGGQRQACAFDARFGAKLDVADRRALQCYGNLGRLGFIRRRLEALRFGLRKDGFLRTLAFYALM